MGPENLADSFPEAVDGLIRACRRENIDIAPDCRQSIHGISPFMITAIAGKYLYRLNAHTKDAIEKQKVLNGFEELTTKKYNSLQLRLNDKKYEMSPETWNWVMNLSNVVREMLPSFQKFHISRLYVGKLLL